MNVPEVYAKKYKEYRESIPIKVKHKADDQSLELIERYCDMKYAEFVYQVETSAPFDLCDCAFEYRINWLLSISAIKAVMFQAHDSEGVDCVVENTISVIKKMSTKIKAYKNTVNNLESD